MLCGFGVGEIARGLLITRAAAKKRIQRAKQVLAEQNVSLEMPGVDELQDRLAVVHNVLYLMFNEGYSTSHGHEPIRDELCEEAARLCHMLCQQQEYSSPTTRALLALMLFHASRLESRIDSEGAVVLLEEQDRSLWDRNLIRAAESWLMRSGGGEVSTFHFEAAIAAQHVRAASVAETNWDVIIKLYDRLLELRNSPIYVLNRAIARGQAGDVGLAFKELRSIRDQKAMSDYFLLDCAEARLHELNGDTSSAIDSYLAAMARNMAEHEKILVQRKLSKLGTSRSQED
ncbi:MAG: putative RNA polymerase sigma factor [Pirellulaceae bacterium]